MLYLIGTPALGGAWKIKQTDDVYQQSFIGHHALPPKQGQNSEK